MVTNKRPICYGFFYVRISKSIFFLISFDHILISKKYCVVVEINHDEQETPPLISAYGVYDFKIQPFAWDFGQYKVKILASTSVVQGARILESYNFQQVSN